MIIRCEVSELHTAANSLEELVFLNAVARDLSDHLPKLVYADWLDERDDDRGAFIREFLDKAKSQSPLPSSEGLSPAWTGVMGFRIIELVREYIESGYLSGPSIAGIEELILRNSTPTLHMAVTPLPDQTIPLGSTKFGGFPDLPKDQPWPTIKDDDQNILCVFCAQIQLGDLRECLIGKDLPESGLLSISVDASGGVVQLIPEGINMERLKPPFAQNRWSQDRNPATLLFRSFDENFFPLPAGGLRMMEGMEIPASDRFPQSFLMENYQPLHEIRSRLIPKELFKGIPEVYHQFMGCGSKGVRKMATFGSDCDSPLYWGDSGQPFLLISENDLTSKQFDKVYFQYG